MYLGADSVAAKPLANASSPQQPLSTTISDIATSIAQATGNVLQVVNQQRLAQLNVDRVRQGLAPIDINSVPGLVPTMNLQAGLDQSTQSLALWVLGGGAAVLLAMSLLGKK